MKSYYEILGIEDDASSTEILRAFRMKAIKLHPDKNKGKDEEFKKLVEAYEILKNPELKKKYDEGDSIGFDIDVYDKRIEKEDLYAFISTYKGSNDEIDDIIEFYNKNNGKISKIFDYIPLLEPEKVELDRVITIIKKLFETKKLEENNKFKTSCKKLLKDIDKLQKISLKNKKQFEKKYGNLSFDELAKTIKNNMKLRNENIDLLGISNQNKRSIGHKIRKKIYE